MSKLSDLIICYIYVYICFFCISKVKYLSKDLFLIKNANLFGNLYPFPINNNPLKNLISYYKKVLSKVFIKLISLFHIS